MGSDGRECGQEGTAVTTGVKDLWQSPVFRSKLSVWLVLVVCDAGNVQRGPKAGTPDVWQSFRVLPTRPPGFYDSSPR